MKVLDRFAEIATMQVAPHKGDETMAYLIEFPSKEACVFALEIFERHDEGYQGLPGNRFIVTSRAVEILEENGVPITFVEKKGGAKRGEES